MRATTTPEGSVTMKKSALISSLRSLSVSRIEVASFVSTRLLKNGSFPSTRMPSLSLL